MQKQKQSSKRRRQPQPQQPQPTSRRDWLTTVGLVGLVGLVALVGQWISVGISILSYQRQTDQLAAVDEAQQQRPRVHNLSMHAVAGSPTVTARLTVVPAARIPAAPRVFRA